ncbi:MAG: HD domain-containing protein [Clostridia bacterium]|nr:HD domain-containing protein [Clostridia bacterium]
MKSIKGKLFFIYILIAALLIGTAFYSYSVIQVSNQHVILSDLLSMEREYVEKVILLTNELSYIKASDKTIFEERLNHTGPIIEASIAMVDDILETFVKKEVLIDGEIIPLKYSKDFEEKFLAAVATVQENWSHANDSIKMILYDPYEENYMAEMLVFDAMEPILVSDVSYINDLCQNETDKQKDFARFFQMSLLIVMVFILLWLITFIKKDIEGPLIKIKSVFQKMGQGNFDVKLEHQSNDEFQSLFESFNQFVDNTNIIRHIEDHILSENNLRTVLNEMLEDFRVFVPIDTISIFYRDSFMSCHKVSTDMDIPEPVENIETYDSIGCLDDNNMVIPIMVNNIYFGYSVFYKSEVFTERDIKFVSGLEQKISFAFQKTLIFKDLLKIVTNGLADLTESRDPETRRHLTRMSLYSRIIAEKLYEKESYKHLIDGEYIENIQLAAPMHDIGKVSVPDHILLKPGKLTEEEFEIMKGHTSAGEKVMAVINEKFSTYNLSYFKMAQDIAHCHQEKYDGSGYPKGIVGHEIPLSARISAVADVFDALTSKRPYKEAFSLEKSYSIIKESSGNHFDPVLVEAFFESQEKIEAVYYEYREI